MAKLGLSDTILAGGCVSLIENVHAEQVIVLDGPDAAKTFLAVQEVEPDVIIGNEVMEDPRGKRVLRFNNKNPIPNVNKFNKVQTADGKIWTLVKTPATSYLTTDYDMVEVFKQA